MFWHVHTTQELTDFSGQPSETSMIWDLSLPDATCKPPRSLPCFCGSGEGENPTGI
jgi:hypothetical protein